MSDTSITPAALEEAADLLDKSGWCRGNYTDGAGRHCAVGALYEVLGGYPNQPRRSTALGRAWTEELGGPWLDELVVYNDGQRDKRKVQRLLRRIARKARQYGVK